MPAAAYDATKYLFENKVAKPLTEGKIRGNMKEPGPSTRPVKPPPAPKPIKIEQISREEAYAQCDFCHRHEPHIHYYVVAKTKKFKTFGDCLIHTRNTMVEFVEGINSMEKDNYKLSAESISCYENFKGFIK